MSGHAGGGHGHDEHGPGGHGHGGYAHGGHGHGGHAHGPENADHLDLVPAEARLAVFASRADVRFSQPAPPHRLRAGLAAFLEGLASDLRAAGCVLIGHIKGSLHGPGGHELVFHITSFDGPVQIAGPLHHDTEQATLTINAVVFGIEETALPDLITKAWTAHTAASLSWSRP